MSSLDNDKDQNNNDFDTELRNELNQFRKRCNELEELKQNVKQLNSTLKNEIFISIGEIGVMLREKNEEFSSQIKENLKLSYKSINEKQENALKDINEIETEYQGKKIEFTLSNQKNLTVEDFNRQLKNSLRVKMDKMNQELKKCDIRGLFPNLAFNLLSHDLIDAIKGLKMEITENERINLSIPSLEQRLKKSTTFNQNDVIECLVTSGMNENGAFWIRNLDEKVDYIIDEINKYIRFQRITDPTWLTISESKREPIFGEKCFHLDSKTNKWMRVIVEIFNMETGKLKVRFLDTSQLVEINIKENSLLEWKEFDLNKIHFQAFKCYLFNKDTEIKYTYSEKFLFRDLIAKKNFKCSFKECIHEDGQDFWVIELNYYEINNNQEQMGSINKLIMEEASREKTFMCEDIRLLDNKNNQKITSNFNVISNVDNKLKAPKIEHNLNNVDDKVEIVVQEVIESILSNIEQQSMDEENDINYVMESILSKIECDEQITKSRLVRDMSRISIYDNIPDDRLKMNVDIRDQSDDNRLFSKRIGTGHVTHMSGSGSFWLNPDIENSRRFDSDLDILLHEHFNSHKSYAELNKTPIVGDKCFVKISQETINKNPKKIPNYRRGWIEEYNPSSELYSIRLLDIGMIERSRVTHIYPFVEMKGTNTKYRAIRCILSQNLMPMNNQETFEKFRQYAHVGIKLKFELIDQYEINGIKYWYTELFNCESNREFINKIVLDFYTDLVNNEKKQNFSSNEKQLQFNRQIYEQNNYYPKSNFNVDPNNLYNQQNQINERPYLNKINSNINQNKFNTGRSASVNRNQNLNSFTNQKNTYGTMKESYRSKLKGITCFLCLQEGHMKSQCPSISNRGEINRNYSEQIVNEASLNFRSVFDNQAPPSDVVLNKSNSSYNFQRQNSSSFKNQQNEIVTINSYQEHGHEPKNNKFKCFGCDKMGHRRSECQIYNEAPLSSSNDKIEFKNQFPDAIYNNQLKLGGRNQNIDACKSKFVCFTCGIEGHSQARCPINTSCVKNTGKNNQINNNLTDSKHINNNLNSNKEQRNHQFSTTQKTDGNINSYQSEFGHDQKHSQIEIHNQKIKKNNKQEPNRFYNYESNNLKPQQNLIQKSPLNNTSILATNFLNEGVSTEFSVNDIKGVNLMRPRKEISSQVESHFLNNSKPSPNQNKKKRKKNSTEANKYERY